jgi:hypothetical protein
MAIPRGAITGHDCERTITLSSNRSGHVNYSADSERVWPDCTNRLRELSVTHTGRSRPRVLRGHTKDGMLRHLECSAPPSIISPTLRERTSRRLRSLLVPATRNLFFEAKSPFAEELYKMAHLERLNSFPGQDLIRSQAVDLGPVANGELVTANDRTSPCPSSSRSVDDHHSLDRLKMNTSPTSPGGGFCNKLYSAMLEAKECAPTRS